MAEDQGKTELSGPAPGPEVPYEERFLSEEKEYPTKEARDLAIREARKPVKSELPHVPPFIETPPVTPAVRPEPQLGSQRDEAWAERLLARNRAEKLTQAAQKPDTKITMAEGENPTEPEAPPLPPYNPAEHIEAKGGAAPLERIIEAQPRPGAATARLPRSAFKIPPEAKMPASMIARKRPAQPVGLSRPPLAKDKLRAQVTQTPAEQPRQSFIGSLLNKIRGRA